MLKVQSDVLPATFDLLLGCGMGERECVVYWLGPSESPEVVDEVLQPPHCATRYHYEIESTWITTLFLDLRSRRKSVKAQVHTHPGSSVDHSPTDDAFALAPTPGFVSIVLPHLATGPIGLDGSYVAQVMDSGWTRVPAEEAIQWT